MTRGNQFLAAILITQLGLFVALRLTRGGESSVGRPTVLFQGLEPKQVKEIAITDGKQDVRLAHKDGRWVLASHGNYPALADTVEKLLTKLPAMSVSAPVATTKNYHRSFKVADDEFERKITLTMADGKTQSLFLGTSPRIKKTHIRMVGSDAVYLAELSVWTAGATASSWVNLDYFKVDRTQIVEVAIRNAKDAFKLIKIDGKWQLADWKGVPDPEKPVDKQKVDGMLGSLSSIMLRDPVGSEDRPEYGFDKPLGQLTIVTEVKEPAQGTEDGSDAGVAMTGSDAGSASVQVSHNLTVGGEAKDGYYARSADSKYIVTISTFTADHIVKKKPADFKPDPKSDKPKPGESVPGLPPGGMPPRGLPPGMIPPR